jgi:hypothetical protein
MVCHHRLLIDNFVARWTELTWRVALVIHAIRYGIECDKYALSSETYAGAVAITKIFFLEQLKVLQALRTNRLHDTHTALQTLFFEGQNAPIPLRTLRVRHGLEKEEVETCVNAYPEMYALTSRKSIHGHRSTLLFLKAYIPESA